MGITVEGVPRRSCRIVGSGEDVGSGEEARRSDAPSGLLSPPELVAQIEQVRAEERAAIQRAADLRDRARELTEQARKTIEQRQEEVLEEVRGRLGLTAQ